MHTEVSSVWRGTLMCNLFQQVFFDAVVWHGVVWHEVIGNTLWIHSFARCGVIWCGVLQDNIFFCVASVLPPFMERYGEVC